MLASKIYAGMPPELLEICTLNGWCLCQTTGHEDGDWQITHFEENEDNNATSEPDETVHRRVGILAMSDNPRRHYPDVTTAEIIVARYALEVISQINHAEYTRIVTAALNYEHNSDL